MISLYHRENGCLYVEFLQNRGQSHGAVGERGARLLGHGGAPHKRGVILPPGRDASGCRLPQRISGRRGDLPYRKRGGSDLRCRRRPLSGGKGRRRGGGGPFRCLHHHSLRHYHHPGVFRHHQLQAERLIRQLRLRRRPWCSDPDAHPFPPDHPLPHRPALPCSPADD